MMRQASPHGHDTTTATDGFIESSDLWSAGPKNLVQLLAHIFKLGCVHVSISTA